MYDWSHVFFIYRVDRKNRENPTLDKLQPASRIHEHQFRKAMKKRFNFENMNVLDHSRAKHSGEFIHAWNSRRMGNQTQS